MIFLSIDKLLSESKDKAKKYFNFFKNNTKLFEGRASPIRQIILHLIAVYGKLTKWDIIEKTNKSEQTIRKHLAFLIDNNFITFQKEKVNNQSSVKLYSANPEYLNPEGLDYSILEYLPKEEALELLKRNYQYYYLVINNTKELLGILSKYYIKLKTDLKQLGIPKYDNPKVEPYLDRGIIKGMWVEEEDVDQFYTHYLEFQDKWQTYLKSKKEKKPKDATALRYIVMISHVPIKKIFDQQFFI